ncbi:glycosyltransferase, partial [Salmonella enterica subsp. enterica serovar Typhi]|nr:glycosyltransferase [Salmonella enterica subsp. enterica serovar Typhi]
MIVNLSRLGKSGTGMWQYSIKFLTALREIADVDAIICSKVHADYFEKLGYAVVTVPNIVSNTSKTSRLRPLVWYVYSYWLALRVLIKFGNKKLVCTTHHTIPLLRNQTITIHDIRPFYYPDSLIQKVYFRFLLKMSVKRCKHVLTVSYTVKDSIAKTYNVDSEKISVIYNSVSKSDFIQKKEKENYFLAVGASWPHKNIHSFIKNKKVWSDSYNLIIVCGRTDYAMSLQQMVVDLKLTDKVTFLHEVSF